MRALRWLVIGIALLAAPGRSYGAAVAETEANNTAATADALGTGFGTGAISATGDIDFWRTGPASILDFVFAYVDTAGSTGTDSFLEVLLNDGTTVLETDNDSGPSNSAAVAGAVVSQAGNVFYRVTENGNDGTISAYTLFQAVVPAQDVAAEVEDNGTVATASIVTARVMTGTVSGSDVDVYSFPVTSVPAKVVAIVDDDPDNDGLLTDTRVSIIDRDGTTGLASGDDLASNKANAAGAATINAQGIYFVKITNGGGAPDTDYRFVVLSNGVPVFQRACCMPDGSCQDLTTAQCNSVGGSGQGPGGFCSATACAQPTGACCLGDCSCNDRDEAACNLAGGRWSGFGSSCGSQNCGVTTFRDAAAFAARAGSVAVEDFEELTGSGAKGCGSPIPDNGICFTTDQIIPGLVFAQEDPNPNITGLIAGFAGFPTATPSDMICGAGTANFLVEFTSPGTRAVGFTARGKAPVRFDLSIEAVGGQVLGTATVFTDSVGTFFGITSPVDLSRLVISSNTSPSNPVCLDDVQIGGLAVTGGDTAGVACAPFGTFVVYAAKTTKDTPKFQKLGPVVLADAFATAGFDVAKPTALGLPANLGGGSLDLIPLTAYAIKSTKGASPSFAHGDVQVTNACGTTAVTTTKPGTLLVPSALDLAAAVPAPNEADHDVDHFLCYQVKTQKKLADGTPVAPFPKGVQMVVGDQFQSRRYDLKKVVALCNPVNKFGTPILLSGPAKGTPVTLTPATIRNPDSHLLCYQAALAKKFIAQDGCGPANPTGKGTTIVPPQPPHSPRLGMHIGDQLGPARLDSTKNALLCIPSTLPAP